MSSHTLISHEYDGNFYTQLNWEFQSNEKRNNKNKRPSMQQTQKNVPSSLSQSFYLQYCQIVERIKQGEYLDGKLRLCSTICRQ